MSNCLVITLNHALIEAPTKNNGEKLPNADLAREHDTESNVSILGHALSRRHADIPMTGFINALEGL